MLSPLLPICKHIWITSGAKSLVAGRQMFFKARFARRHRILMLMLFTHLILYSFPKRWILSFFKIYIFFLWFPRWQIKVYAKNLQSLSWLEKSVRHGIILRMSIVPLSISIKCSLRNNLRILCKPMQYVYFDGRIMNSVINRLTYIAHLLQILILNIIH